jgi:6-phosphogluconolactonase
MRHWFGRMAAAISVGALALATGCNGFFVYPGSTGSGSSTSSDYVYVANATTATVSGYLVGTNALTAVANSPFTLTFTPTAVAVNPANSIVFVAGSSSISAFSIQSGGVLSVLTSGGVLGVDAIAMDISPDGNWLLVLDGNGLSIEEFQINSTTGALTQVPSTFYTVSSGTVVPRAIRFAPSGNYVFVALGTAGDLVYTFNTALSSGALTNLLTLAAPVPPMSDNALAVSPNSSTLYIARSNSTAAGAIVAYSIGAGGALSPISSAITGALPSSVAVNNAGTDVYVANQIDSTISGFSVTGSGTLTALSGSPYTSGSSVAALAADRTGSYLLAAAHGGSPDLTMYSFDSTTAGKLDFSTSTATGTDPTGAVALATTH